MNINNLINKLRYKKVFNEIHKYYLVKYETKKIQEYDCKFYDAWNSLKKLKYKESDDEEVNDSVIQLTKVSEEGEEYIDIHLLYEKTGATYGMDFLGWEHLLNKAIKTELKLNEEQIMCHVFWELTFWGWTSENTKRSGELIAEEGEEGEEVDIDDFN